MKWWGARRIMKRKKNEKSGSRTQAKRWNKDIGVEEEWVEEG